MTKEHILRKMCSQTNKFQSKNHTTNSDAFLIKISEYWGIPGKKKHRQNDKTYKKVAEKNKYSSSRIEM